MRNRVMMHKEIKSQSKKTQEWVRVLISIVIIIVVWEGLRVLVGMVSDMAYEEESYLN